MKRKEKVLLVSALGNPNLGPDVGKRKTFQDRASVRDQLINPQLRGDLVNHESI